MLPIKLAKHPILKYNADLADICRPLTHLSISYFGHARVTDGKLSALCTNPEFFTHYMKNNFHNVGLHARSNVPLGKFLIWDTVELDSHSARIWHEAEAFGLQHSCTIISADGKDFYHFSSSVKTKSINQVFISQHDLLQKFIPHFHSRIEESKYLRHAYDTQFEFTPITRPGFSLEQNLELPNTQQQRLAFLSELNELTLPPQQLKCLLLLVEGHSIKHAARLLDLSPKTVEHYLSRIRKKLGCKNSKELIARYFQDQPK